MEHQAAGIQDTLPGIDSLFKKAIRDALGQQALFDLSFLTEGEDK